MVGAPVAGRLGRACTAAVAALVSDSGLPASSVNDRRTLMALPSSPSVSVYALEAAPAMAAPSASHW